MEIVQFHALLGKVICYVRKFLDIFSENRTRKDNIMLIKFTAGKL